MNDYTKRTKQIKPSQQYPALVKKLAKVSYLAQELHDELTHESIGEALGISKQGVAYQVNKLKGKKS